MRYNMTEPCDACPFLLGSGFTFASLMRHASGEFPCHKACEVDEDSGEFHARNDKTPHCAGALIFLEKREEPHQMMRICERLGMYDRTKLNMDAYVGSEPSDYRAIRRREQTMIAAQMTESRAAMIQRWEREGRLDPNCPGCREFYESPLLPVDVWAPSHKASSGCESGKRAHCSCDLCF